jgi:hypothetical protein
MIKLLLVTVDYHQVTSAGMLFSYKIYSVSYSGLISHATPAAHIDSRSNEFGIIEHEVLIR